MIGGEAMGMDSHMKRAGFIESWREALKPSAYRVNAYTKMRPSGARPTQPLVLPVRRFGL